MGQLPWYSAGAPYAPLAEPADPSLLRLLYITACFPTGKVTALVPLLTTLTILCPSSQVLFASPDARRSPGSLTSRQKTRSLCVSASALACARSQPGS